MQRHESELARMARGAGHEDPARFEQGPELGVGRRGARGLGRVAGRACGRRQLDERVDGDDDAVGADDQRVDVDARHVVAFGGESAEADQHAGERFTFDGGLAPELAEQFLRREAVDHVECRLRRHRRGAEHDVGDRFGENAPDPEHHGRSELRVAHHTCDQLPVAADHRCDEHIDVTVVGCRRREQIGRGAFDAGSVAEPEPHETPLGLVGDRVAVQLRHDRITDLVGRLPCLGRARCEPLGGDRHVEGCEQRLRFPLGQRGRRVRGRAGGRVGHDHHRPNRTGDCSANGGTVIALRSVRSGHAGVCTSTGISAAAKNSMMCSRRRSSAAGANGFSSRSPSRNGASEK